MTILDSSIWIAYLYQEDNQHKKAVDVWEATDDTIVVPEYVMIEVCTVLPTLSNKRHADSFIHMIQNNKDVSLLYAEQEFVDEVIRFYLQYQYSNLSFIDISLLFLSKHYTVLTFDRALGRAITEHCQTT